jgi:hypothetical protein
MTPPFPSFPKIRFVVLLIGFLAAFFVLGLVKSAFAGWPGVDPDRCPPKVAKSGVEFTDNTTLAYENISMDYDTSIFTKTERVPIRPYYTIEYVNYYWDGVVWVRHRRTYEQPYTSDSPELFEPDYNGSNYLTAENEFPECIPCEDEKQQAISECGDDNWSWTDVDNCKYACDNCIPELDYLSNICGGEGTYEIDNETCKGHCIPTGDCAEEYEAKVIECGDIGIKKWNNENCTGECNDCVKEPPCDRYAYWCYEVHCYNTRGVVDYECKAEVDENGCWQVNKKVCKCDETPPGDCDQYRTYVEQQCQDSDGIAKYECDPNDFENKHYKCYNISPKPPEDPTPPPEDPENPPEDPSDPTPGEGDSGNPPEDPADPTDSSNPDPTEKNTKLIVERLDKANEHLENISKNQEATVDNTGKTVERLDTANDKLQNIAENQAKTVSNLGTLANSNQTTADNTGDIAYDTDSIDENTGETADNTAGTAKNTGDMVALLTGKEGKGLKIDSQGGLGAVNDKLTALKGVVSGMSDGDYSPGEFGEAYELPEAAEGEPTQNEFSNRLTLFFTTIQLTGLFSLADSLSANIPSSGSSQLTIEAGQYGTHQFNFLSWGNALLVLRYVFLTVFGWVAIRIVLLKR